MSHHAHSEVPSHGGDSCSTAETPLFVNDYDEQPFSQVMSTSVAVSPVPSFGPLLHRSQLITTTVSEPARVASSLHKRTSLPSAHGSQTSVVICAQRGTLSHRRRFSSLVSRTATFALCSSAKRRLIERRDFLASTEQEHMLSVQLLPTPLRCFTAGPGTHSGSFSPLCSAGRGRKRPLCSCRYSSCLPSLSLANSSCSSERSPMNAPVPGMAVTPAAKWDGIPRQSHVPCEHVPIPTSDSIDDATSGVAWAQHHGVQERSVMSGSTATAVIPTAHVHLAAVEPHRSSVVPTATDVSSCRIEPTVSTCSLSLSDDSDIVDYDMHETMARYTAGRDFRHIDPIADGDQQTCNRINSDLERLQEPEHVSAEQLNYLLRKHAHCLRDIAASRLRCSRHKYYIESDARGRTQLDTLVPLQFFQDQSLSLLTDLLPHVVHVGALSGDYLSRVILPEILIRIYGDIRGLTRKAADIEMREMWHSVDHCRGRFL